ncbi:hypothetical protein ZBT109_1296 [Zymobacter palmae]|uniref:Uncharacterized protein n=1 Tax=Zymobacter palmae TaxID=33074 RepID=A0A348HEK4_9GAMM|nr:hypothetical protein ZBT109_1296 [Zymobacter palmae]
MSDSPLPLFISHGDHLHQRHRTILADDEIDVGLH